jgi:hypothetical protein
MTLTRFAFLNTARRNAVRIATLTLGAASLSACAYGAGDYGGYGGVSIGVGSGGGYAGGYDPYCDGYSAWDSFYGCDYGYGFGQIGYGGGYFDNFYYPGYGTWLYDRPGGRRFAMQDRHRQYWGQQRWQYQQQRRANRQDFRQDRRDDRQDVRRDRREDRRDVRQDRRETLQDRRDWRQEQGQPQGEFPRTRRGERERMGGLTPEDRQRQLDRWQQRQNQATGQPAVSQPGQPAGRAAERLERQQQRQAIRQGRIEQGGGQGRQRPAMRQPDPQAQPNVARPPRAERAPRPERQERIDRAPRSGQISARDRASGVRAQDVRPD